MKFFKLFLAGLLIHGMGSCSVAVAGPGDTRIRADYVDGQDSSRNYIKDGDAETGTAVKGWTCYNDSGEGATTSPVNGTGGTPNVTFTKTTSSPLENNNSFVFTKDSANRIGQGCSYDFTIDARLKSKMLQITFDNLVGSGTFAAGSDTTNSDVMVYLYDITNSKLIPLQGQTKFYSNSTTLAEPFRAWYQAAPDSVNYRLILHVASTSASAFTLKSDVFKVSESKQVVGTIITELQSWDPTLSFATGSTSAAITKNCQWRRVGDIGEYYCDINFGAGTIGTWTVPYVSLPTGHVIDTTNGPASLISSIPCRANVGNAYPGVSTVPAVNTIGCRVNSVTTHTGTAPTPESDITSTFPAPFTNGSSIRFNLRVKIAGWSAGARMSDGYGGMPIKLSAYRQSTPYPGVGSPIVIDTVTEDSALGFNASTGRYTFKMSRSCSLSADVAFGHTGSTDQYIGVALYKNGSSIAASIGTSRAVSSMSSVRIATIPYSAKFNAGDIVDVRVTGTNITGLTSVVEYSSFTITCDNSTPFMSPYPTNTPTIQRFTSGSGTYTTPVGVKYIVVEMVGGGGGGAGGGTTGGVGGNGGNTTFGTSLLTASGGSGGPSSGSAGQGGAATVNAPAVLIDSVIGGYGGGAMNFVQAPGNSGGNSYFGGSGAGVPYGNIGMNGSPGTGGGGGGGGNGTGDKGGSGGGAGGYLKARISSPSATYSYSVGVGGTAGTAGTNGAAGGVGGSGKIIIEEYYQ